MTNDGRGETALAWERSGPSTSNAPMGVSDLSAHLERTIAAVT